MAASWREKPTATEAVAGATAKELRIAVVVAVTVSAALPLVVPELAVMVLLPTARALTRPPGVTVAMAVALEDQVTVVVMSWFVPSLNRPVAVNCLEKPMPRVWVAGATVMELSVAGPPPGIGPPPPPPLQPRVAITRTDRKRALQTRRSLEKKEGIATPESRIRFHVKARAWGQM